jgi:hypothetical protein
VTINANEPTKELLSLALDPAEMNDYLTQMIAQR